MDYVKEIESWPWRYRRVGLTQADFARKAGISPGEMNRIIKKKSIPKSDTLQRVASVLLRLEAEIGIDDRHQNPVIGPTYLRDDLSVTPA